MQIDLQKTHLTNLDKLVASILNSIHSLHHPVAGYIRSCLNKMSQSVNIVLIYNDPFQDPVPGIDGDMD